MLSMRLLWRSNCQHRGEEVRWGRAGFGRTPAFPSRRDHTSLAMTPNNADEAHDTETGELTYDARNANAEAPS